MNTSIFQAEYNDEGIRNIIFENISKMLFNRHIIPSDTDMNTQLVKNYDNNTSFYKSKPSDDDNHLKKVAVKLLLRKITTINKVDDIDDFLDKYNDYYKIVVVSKITPKAHKQFLAYENIEVFGDDELLTNKIDHIFVPKHIILTAEQQEQIRKEYEFKRNEISKIKQSDPIARYYNLKVGQIIMIERPSITSGISINYRICIPSALI